MPRRWRTQPTHGHGDSMCCKQYHAYTDHGVFLGKFPIRAIKKILDVVSDQVGCVSSTRRCFLNTHAGRRHRVISKTMYVIVHIPLFSFRSVIFADHCSNHYKTKQTHKNHFTPKIMSKPCPNFAFSPLRQF